MAKDGNKTVTHPKTKAGTSIGCCGQSLPTVTIKIMAKLMPIM
jgi:hypothetical protein